MQQNNVQQTAGYELFSYSDAYLCACRQLGEMYLLCI